MRAARIAPVLGLALAWLLCFGWPQPLQAESYIWTDAQGRVHITDDLSQVPPNQREHARQAAEAAQGKSQNQLPGAYAPPASLDPAVAMPRAAPVRSALSTSRKSARARSTGRIHVLQVERAGSEMRVVAVLDGGVEVPFILDTGASVCTLPAWAVGEMGITIDKDTPRAPLVGIDGQPMYVPEIEVGSVAIGDAVVENLEMRVLDTMQEGLLGMPFFNHFKVSTDPTAGTITLEEIDFEQVDDVIGGKNERAWRQQFAELHGQLATVRQRLADTPSQYVTRREQLERQQQELERKLDELEDKATREGVPNAWRD